MKFKIIMGIIIPALAVVFLAILGSIGSLSVEQKYVQQLSFADILANNRVADSIKIGDIFLENDYFLSKRFDLPRLGVCLQDKDGSLQRIEAGQIQYNEGEYVPGEGVLEPVYDTHDYGYYDRGRRSVEVKPYQKKNTAIFLQPSYNFKYSDYSRILNATELNERYGGYDELIVFEMGDYQYNCYSVGQEILENAVKIPLVKV